jgi:hypothetical protein
VDVGRSLRSLLDRAIFPRLVARPADVKTAATSAWDEYNAFRPSDGWLTLTPSPSQPARLINPRIRKGGKRLGRPSVLYHEHRHLYFVVPPNDPVVVCVVTPKWTA